MIKAFIRQLLFGLPTLRFVGAAELGQDLPSNRRASRIPCSGRLVLRLLQRLEVGTLDLVLPDGRRIQRVGKAPDGAPHAIITLHRWRCCRALLWSGDIGFAQAYIDGDWESPDLTAVLELAARNRAQLAPLIYGGTVARWLFRLRHWRNRNTRVGSRRNIHAHYDLGNEFYRLWLDSSMTYSSALFDASAAAGDLDDDVRLADAQQAKYWRIFDQLQVGPGAKLLEIGCGWGGFAETALGAGAEITGITLSPAQLQWAQARCAALQRGAHAELRLQDYRDVDGQYDGIASIEMFEAVGEAYWSDYFKTLARCLKPGARACVQTITIADELFDAYRSGSDFIQQYIFPGGMLPSRTAFAAAATQAGLRVVDSFAFGLDYARTLRVWRERFTAVRGALESQGFDERFERTWRFYLSYCEAGFRSGATDVYQFTLARI